MLQQPAGFSPSVLLCPLPKCPHKQGHMPTLPGPRLYWLGHFDKMASRQRGKMKESELYAPVKEYLENHGYRVNAEVAGCDITATKGEEFIIVELKRSFSLELLGQAVDRQDITDSVYVAIPAGQDRMYPPNYKRMTKLLKRLELGLIFVRFLKTKTSVEVIFHPDTYERKKPGRKRRAVLREAEGRIGDFNVGGSPSRTEKLTLYKQNAVQIAVYLSILGEASPKQLREMGTVPNTQRILNNNFYGWFEKVERGVYRLHEHGRLSIEQYPELVAYFTDQFRSS